jgi:hypothetical protein
MSQQLDFSRPLWQVHLIGSYDGGCALAGRVHHCLADGPALMDTLLALTDTETSAPLAATVAQALPAPPEPPAPQHNERNCWYSKALISSSTPTACAA